MKRQFGRRSAGGAGLGRPLRLAPRRSARATQAAVSNARDAAVERIERATQVLNRTIGGGIAIG